MGLRQELASGKMLIEKLTSSEMPTSACCHNGNNSQIS